MTSEYTLRPVARIRSDFTQKFGIPRQSGMAPGLESAIVFEPPYRDPNALRGLEEYSHLWLVWQFSQVVEEGQDGENWRPLVRPPGWEETPEWGYGPPAALSGPMPWG